MTKLKGDEIRNEIKDLNIEQLYAFHKIYNEERNFFLTGPGGCGKSFLVKKLVKILNPKNISACDITKEMSSSSRAHIGVAVVAFTGRAAADNGGQTLHSWMGFNYEKMMKDAPSGEKVSANSTAKKKVPYDLFDDNELDMLAFHAASGLKESRRISWERTSMLIIDEISMVPIVMLKLVDKVARLVRDSPDAPFGGMQVVLCGDFCQLKPVTSVSTASTKSKSTLLFEEPFFEKYFGGENTFYMSKSERNKDDLRFFELLLKIRKNQINDVDVYNMLRSRNIPKKDSVVESADENYTTTIGNRFYVARGVPKTQNPTRIFFSNFEVREFNKNAMKKDMYLFDPEPQQVSKNQILSLGQDTFDVDVTITEETGRKPLYEFHCKTAVLDTEMLRHKFQKKNSKDYTESINKITEQMSWKTIENHSVEKGSEIEWFALHELFESTRFTSYRDHEDALLREKHTHLDTGTFDYSAYTSEKSLKDKDYFRNKHENNIKEIRYIKSFKVELFEGAPVMVIKNINVSEGICNGTVGTIVGFAKGSKYPIVKLKNGTEHVFGPQKWFIENEERSFFALIYAIPLVLGYSTNVHKAQGMTLENGILVDMQRFREDSLALAYTAFSRVRKVDDLFIVNLDFKKITQCQRSVKYYEELERKSKTIMEQVTPILNTPEGLVTKKQKNTNSDILNYIHSSIKGREKVIVSLIPPVVTEQISSVKEEEEENEIISNSEKSEEITKINAIPVAEEDEENFSLPLKKKK